jgi:tRNA A-37 threonylcarbamoyl transferase component Bud32/sugar lactone lactonase YvrE
MGPGNSRDGETCPGREDLRAFAVGKLSPDRLKELAAHLEGCRRCVSALQEIPDTDDALVAGLRHCNQGMGLTRTPPTGLSPSGSQGLPAGPIGNYEVQEEVGRGATGVVYKARQGRPSRLVALKVLQVGALASATTAERFRREAETLARLQHPNIVRVIEVGEYRGLPFFSLEYCPGGSLHQKLGGTPLPPREAAALAETLARALHAAHQARVIHRDLKPANVLLAEDGTPKVTDFGLAKLLEEAGQTKDGAVMGTPSYMAPEQAQGKTREVGPAADVYALGAVLYECLTGRPPFKGATVPDTLVQVISTEPVPPSRLNPKVPRDLETVCLKCLEKSPGRRYPSARDLAEDLGRYQRGEAVRARPVTRLERGWKWAKRHPARAAVLGLLLVVVLLGLGGGGSLWLWLQAEAAFDQAERSRQEAVDAGNKEVTARKQAEDASTKLEAARAQLALANRQVESLLYCMHTNKAHEQLLSYDLLGCRATLEECQQHLRGPEYGYLLNQLARKARTLPGHWDMVASLALSGDGKRLYSGGSDGTIKVWDLEAGKEARTLRGHTGGVSSLALSADGRRLCSGSDDQTIKVWDLEAGKEARTLPGHWDMVASLALSGDGKRLYSGSDDQTIKVWDLEAGKETLTLRGQTGPVYTLALSGDGKRLYSGGGDGTIKVWDLEAGKEARTLPGHWDMVASLALSGDGKRLYSGGREGTIKVWDLQAGKEARTLRGHTGGVSSLALSADGRRLYSGSRDWTIKVWDLEAGKEALTLRGHTGGVSSLALSADGKRLYSGGSDGTIKVWDLQAGKEASP